MEKHLFGAVCGVLTLVVGYILLRSIKSDKKGETILKIIKILLTIITIIFAALGLANVLSYDISQPIMLVSLGTLLLLNAVEYKRKQKAIAIFNGLAALFIYAVVIVRLYWR